MQNFRTMTASYQSVVTGSFEAESFWAPGNQSGLPVMSDEAAKKVTSAMDELLFLLCQEEEDLLLTQNGFHPVLKDYLGELGFLFSCNTEAFSINENKTIPVCHPEKVAGAVFDPFAVLPGMEEWCQSFGVEYHFPALPCIGQVNSKMYSHNLRCEMGLDYGCFPVHSAQELLSCGQALLEKNHRGIIVKDPYGVSGKGNLLIQSPAILNRIARFVEKQEQNGAQTEFLLEPCLEKREDFACAASIAADGTVKILTVQSMKTTGLAYGGSFKMPPALYDYIEKSDYLKHITSACQALSRNGYFGDVCFDSMLLQDGGVIPIVEINARKSMTLLKHYLDKKLQSFGQRAFFSYSPLVAQPGFSFSQLLFQLQQEGLLFTRQHPEGILPLSANTLNESSVEEISAPKKKQRGRLYFAAAARTEEEIEAYFARMQLFLERVKTIEPACKGSGRTE